MQHLENKIWILCPFSCIGFGSVDFDQKAKALNYNKQLILVCPKEYLSRKIHSVLGPKIPINQKDDLILQVHNWSLKIELKMQSAVDRRDFWDFQDFQSSRQLRLKSIDDRLHLKA